MNNFADRTMHLVSVLLLLWGMFVSAAVAQVPRLITYQGHLNGSSGQAVDATVTMVFKLYNDPGPVTALYSETQSVTVTNGYFNVTIGALTPLTLPFDVPYYLGITVGTDAEMTPRQTLTAAPYALRTISASQADAATNATNAAQLGGVTANNYVQTSDSRLTDARPPTPGSANYIQNGTSQQASSNFNISGNGTAGGTISAAALGIGTTNPVGPVHVKSAIPRFLGDPNTLSGFEYVDFMGHTSIYNSDLGGMRIQRQLTSGDIDVSFFAAAAGTAASEKMRVTGKGMVGINTTTPSKATLEIDSAVGSVNYPGGGTVMGFAGVATASSYSGNVSLYAAYPIAAQSVFAYSDERMKRIAGRSDAAHDLATLAGIEVTDYTYIDTIARGTGRHKKVIAQQVRSVYPQAVRLSTDVVPDIYKNAETREGWILLATNLKKGERVRLIGMKKDGIHEVLEVARGKFRTDFTPDASSVFVYGREVQDFGNVDYEAIAMLNVSATQELTRRLEKQAKELAAQSAEITALKLELTRIARLADEQASLLTRPIGRPVGSREVAKLTASQ